MNINTNNTNTRSGAAATASQIHSNSSGGSATAITVTGQTSSPPNVVVVDLESQVDTLKTTTTKKRTQSNNTSIRLNHDLTLLKKKSIKKRESTTTVRVQVPHKNLLHGNKIIVELAGTCPQYQHLPPFEAVVQSNVQPGAIFTIQVPTTIRDEEDGIMMHYPAYTSTHSLPTDQQEQQSIVRVRVKILR